MQLQLPLGVEIITIEKLPYLVQSGNSNNPGLVEGYQVFGAVSIDSYDTYSQHSVETTNHFEGILAGSLDDPHFTRFGMIRGYARYYLDYHVENVIASYIRKNATQLYQQTKCQCSTQQLMQFGCACKGA